MNKEKKSIFRFASDSFALHFSSTLSTDKIAKICYNRLTAPEFRGKLKKEMLPMAMHQKQDRTKRKQKSSTVLRSSRLSLEHMFPEEGLKPGPYSFGSSTLYENVSDVESAAQLKKTSCSAIMVSNQKISRISSPSRNLSVTRNHVPINTIHEKKSIDMRPLSVPPKEAKRTSPVQSRCYLALGIATIVVCGIAFTVWLTYDSLGKFVSSLLN
ncbi:hypothetical protein LOAG_17022 [Loa loa]|uniref:Uncharacterized protein n=2 Tax=Loa loa TaxID=7209 RepID=A0A1S0UKD6_LOALO|nr:hypothetical protein LOAG_17022 [Loa loa]EJD75941.1 hypothetical protein LOAG_17022 [Loa loa]